MNAQWNRSYNQAATERPLIMSASACRLSGNSRAWHGLALITDLIITGIWKIIILGRVRYDWTRGVLGIRRWAANKPLRIQRFSGKAGWNEQASKQ